MGQPTKTVPVRKQTRAVKSAARKALYKKVVAQESRIVEKELQKIPKKVGSPSKYTDEIASRICAGLTEGKSMRKILLEPNMPTMSTVFLWLTKHEKFSENYTHAMKIRTETMLEDLIEISDDSSNDYVSDDYMEGKTPGYQVNQENIQRSKLRVETRKWIMAKMQPKKYGDKLDLTNNGKDLPTPILGIIEQPKTISKAVIEGEVL